MINKLDDREQYFNFLLSQCTTCKYFHRYELQCKAYPDGIPLDILEGLKKHDNILEGQSGETIFEKKRD